MNMEFARLPKRAQDFFLSKSWEADFDRARLNRGRSIYNTRNANIDNLLTDTEGAVFGFFSVAGSYAYEVEVNLSTKNRLYTFCDCPDSAKCKHIAAAIYELVSHIEENYTQSLPIAETSVSIESWLENLSDTLSDDSTCRDEEEEFSPSYKDRVLYLLGQEYEYDEYGLHAYKGRLQKDGTFKIVSFSVRTDYQEYNKPKYITNTDLQLLHKISLANQSFYGGSSISINSLVFQDILLECLATGRVIAKGKASVHDRSVCYTPLTLGDARSVSPSWTSAAEGALKPTILISPQPDEVIASSPKCYIDRAMGCAGSLQQTHSDEFLEKWLRGPAISPSEVQKVQKLIEQKTPSTPEEPQKETSEVKPLAIIPPLPTQRTITDLQPTPTLSIERVDAAASASLFIQNPVANILIGSVSFDYGQYSVPATPYSDTFSSTNNHEITTIHRDKKQENKLLRGLKNAPKVKLKKAYDSAIIKKSLAESLIYSPTDSLNTQQWIAFISTEVPALEAAGWRVIIGDLDYTLLEYDSFYEDLSESEAQKEWFRFDLGIEHNGEKISLIPALAAAISSGMYEGYDFASAGDNLIAIPVDKENTFINFPAKRFKLILDKVQDIFQHINSKGEISIPQLRAATLIDDLDLEKSNRTLTELAALGKQLSNIKGLPKTRVPKNLNAQLRDYQIEGFRWLQFLAKYKLHGVLADDMGLGKTIQTITHILAEKNAKRNKGLPTLVVAPTSVIPNWRAEIAKFAPSLSALLLHGSDRKTHFQEVENYDIVITSYALLQRDEAVHLKQHYHIVILDESQYIKNAATKTTKVAYQLEANHRVCLSGTPMENHLGELWSTFNFLMPGLLQSNKDFTATFRTPIERNADTAKQISLNRRVGPLLLRRTKDVVAKELPPKTIIPHHISLNQEQVDLYESVRATMDKRVRDAIKDQGLSKSQIIILDALLKLRQICCHPQLLKLKEAQKIESSAKLDYLTDLLGTLIEEGRRILIFSQFTTMLSMIEKHLKKEKIKFVKITGATRNRETPVEKFQSGEIPVFLISLKAGGTGLNLTAADTVIHYDPWWNPAAENQATDRAYRIGQDKPVFVHKLICQGTIEEHIQTLQEKKSQLVESLLSGSTNKLSLTSETLNGLLAPIDV